MTKKPIQMPRRGFYLAVSHTSVIQQVIFVSGTTKGNRYARYFRPNPGQKVGETWDWMGLMWNCVPKQAELDTDYRFFETHADLLANMQDGSLKKAAAKKDPSC